MPDRPVATHARRADVLACVVAWSVALAGAALAVAVAGWTAWTAVVTGNLLVAGVGVVVLVRRRRTPGGLSSTVVAAVLIGFAVLAIGTTALTWCHVGAHGVDGGVRGH